MQTRLDVTATFSPLVGFFAQAQDVRFWGEETRTAGATANEFDFHQAYLTLGNRETPLRARIGRQEYEIGFGRLLGIPIWSAIGRAYDGVTATASLSNDARVELFGFQIREEESPASTSDEYLAGAWAEFGLGDTRTLHLFGLHDRDNADPRTARTTLGTEYVATSGPVFYRIEAAVQSGQVAGSDLTAASLLAGFARVGFAEGRGTVGLGLERYGGDATPGPGETAGFSDLFGRNHRFLGFADLFNDPRANTNGRGLTNLDLRGTWDLRDGLILRVDLHRFAVVDDDGLGDGHLADEIDVQVFGPLYDQLDVRAGASWVGGGDGGRALGTITGDQRFGYIMLSVGTWWS